MTSKFSVALKKTLAKYRFSHGSSQRRVAQEARALGYRLSEKQLSKIIREESGATSNTIEAVLAALLVIDPDIKNDFLWEWLECQSPKNSPADLAELSMQTKI